MFVFAMSEWLGFLDEDAEPSSLPTVTHMLNLG
jgi:hypothetical protein